MSPRPPAPHDVPFELQARRHAVGPPVRYALLIAGAYVVFGVLYIVVSTWLAAHSAMSVEQLETIERWKGIAFIAATAGLLFALVYALFHRIRAQEAQLARQTQALHNSERALLAGTFAGTIAHDINNALTASTLATEELEALTPPDSEERRLAACVQESLRAIAEWNRRLFDLGNRHAGGPATQVDIDALVASCVAMAQRHAHLRQRLVTLTHAPVAVRIPASEALVRRAVLNLVLNAAEACGPDGRIDVSVAAEPDGAVCVRVDDSGPGVPPALRRRILEPLFTTKVDGTGFGLASVVACAEFHRGEVRIDDAPLGGARFELRLRARAERAA